MDLTHKGTVTLETEHLIHRRYVKKRPCAHNNGLHDKVNYAVVAEDWS